MYDTRIYTFAQGAEELNLTFASFDVYVTFASFDLFALYAVYCVTALFDLVVFAF